MDMKEMPEIFVSHMANDTEYKNYFSDIFILAKTIPIFEELEQIVAGKIFSSKIIDDIDRAKAVFVILSQDIQKEIQKHTRDWIVWETGVAAAKQKEIWIFEPAREFGEISIVIPYSNHYMLFDRSHEHMIYIKKIIESYSNPSIIHRPLGISATCQNCFWTYQVHPPNTNRFRCPTCNKFFDLRI